MLVPSETIYVQGFQEEDPFKQLEFSFLEEEIIN
jgi:hypothetical protein